MNEFNLIGKAINDLEIKTSESGNTYAQMLLEIKRPFKNKDGDYDYDIIQITMFSNCADEAKDIVKEGTVLLIKGHISSSSYSKDDKVFYTSSIIADRIGLLNQMI